MSQKIWICSLRKVRIIANESYDRKRVFSTERTCRSGQAAGVLISLDQIKNYGQSKVESDIKRNLMQLRLNIKRKELLQRRVSQTGRGWGAKR